MSREEFIEEKGMSEEKHVLIKKNKKKQKKKNQLTNGVKIGLPLRS